MFAATMIAFGILGLLRGDFAAIWDFVPQTLPARMPLVYCCALVSLIGGIGLLRQETAASASRLLFVYSLLWLSAFKLRFIFHAPLVEGSYQTCGETAVVVAGAWALYACYASDRDRRYLKFAVGSTGVRCARVFYGLSLTAFGLSHFVYLKLTTSLVPGWLPAPAFWAYFTGATYLAAGVAILIGVRARLAAVLCAWQIGLFLVLVWLPKLASAYVGAGEWDETCVNAALLASAWVMADGYRHDFRMSYPPTIRSP